MLISIDEKTGIQAKTRICPDIPGRPGRDARREAQITEFTIRHNETAHPYKWSYDADADHARYLERHPRQQNLAQAA